MDYRREIDGLRAFAVLPVILFHAGFETFSGGFVGVDVFFAISGYLITTIILAELEQGKFSIINFYERRARRILPALFLVILVCIPFAWFWLLPSDMKDFSESLAAVSVFASNIFFWRESGYFDTAAELKPLVHTWSLAVEEQYYVLFPLFLMLFWKLGKRWILVTLGLVFVASLAVAQWAAYANPAAAFYLLPTRGWELLIGAFAAFYLSQPNRKNFGKGLSEFGGWLGVALILYAIFAYSKTTPFPGFFALVPTIGAVLIILFATQQNTVGKFVGNKAFVAVGLISYSAYLWHQPLFAFARHQSSNDPSQIILGLLSFLAIFLGYLSWKFVEGPFRKRGFISRSKVFLLSFFVTVVILVIGIIGHLNNGYTGRLPSNLVWESLGAKLAANGDVCDPQPVADYDGINACKFGAVGSNKSVILYGDSHAQAINEYLNKEFTKHNIEGIKIGLKDCQIVPSILDTKDPLSKGNECSARFESLKAYIVSNNADVIVISRWSFRLYPIKGVIDQMPYQNSEGGREFESYREYAVIKDGKLDFSSKTKSEAVEELVEGFLATNQRIFFIYPVPEIAWNIAKKNFNYYKRYRTTLGEISIPYEDFKTRNRFVINIFDSFSNRENFYPVRPSEVFCNSFVKSRCVAQYDSVPYYYDDDHLSDEGAKLVVDKFLRTIVNE
jgi:peptidoglycan/LPS O-acetylase OafA/YrhL